VPVILVVVRATPL